jgi:hypothetical protein
VASIQGKIEAGKRADARFSLPRHALKRDASNFTVRRRISPFSIARSLQPHQPL